MNSSSITHGKLNDRIISLTTYAYSRLALRHSISPLPDVPGALPQAMITAANAFKMASQYQTTNGNQVGIAQSYA